jgi:ribosomal protein L36
MKVRTSVKAGGQNLNHNQSLVRGLKVRTSLKSGKIAANDNQTLVRDVA